MVPSQGSHHVSPSPVEVGVVLVFKVHVVGDPGSHFRVKSVVAQVGAQVKFVPVGKLMCELGIHIVEIVPGGSVSVASFRFSRGFYQWLGQHVDISSSGRYIERGFFPDDRPFELNFRGDQADTCRPAYFLVVTVFHPYIYHR